MAKKKAKDAKPEAPPAKPKAKDAKSETPPAKPKGTLGKARAAVTGAAGAVAKAVTGAAEVVSETVVQPVAQAVGVTKKAKKTRYVRPKKETKPQTAPASLPPRSTSTTAKIMTKGLAVLPKEAGGNPGRGSTG